MDQHVLGDEDYRQLLSLRTELRRFLRWGEAQAKAAGITATQHQLLLAIRGDDAPDGPTIGDVADHLLLQHHSTVELVQRAERAGLVLRREDPDDGRLVRLALSPAGAAVLEGLSALHAEEIRRLAGDGRVTGQADGGRPDRTTARDAGAVAGVVPPAPVGARDAGAVARVGAPAAAPAPPPALPDTIRVRGVDERPRADEGRRVLVDRLWPRGVRAEDAPFDEWLSAIAPSTELRRWFDHDPDRYAEFAERYRGELHARQEEELQRLAAIAVEDVLVLLTATTDLGRSAAALLADEVARRLSSAT